MKKLNKIYILLFIAIANILALSGIPESGAKYHKTEDISYKTNIAKIGLTEEEKTTATTISLDGDNSTASLAIFNATFKRNDIGYTNTLKPDKANIYTINVEPNTCSITSINEVETNSNQLEINLGDTSIPNTIPFEIKCSEDYTNGLDISVNYTIKESVRNYEGNIDKKDNNNFELNYISKGITIPYADYYKDNRIPLPDPSVYNLYPAAITALRGYMTEHEIDESYYSTLLAYFNSVFASDLEDGDFVATATASEQPLKGFTYTTDVVPSKTDFDDNFLGYALTYNFFTNNDNESNYVFTFIRGLGETARTNDFNYFLDTYATSKIGSSGVNKIKTYISNYTNQMNDVFANRVPEITLENGQTKIYTLSFNSNILGSIDYSINPVNGFDIIYNETSATAMYMSFLGRISTLYGEGTIFGKFYEILLMSPHGDVYNTIVANNAEYLINNELEIFSRNHILTTSDDKRLLLYSYSYGNGNNYNYVYEIANNTDIELVSIDGDDTAMLAAINDIYGLTGESVLTSLGTKTFDSGTLRLYTNGSYSFAQFDVIESGHTLTYTTFTYKTGS